MDAPFGLSHPPKDGETQQNATADSQISFPSIPTERQENKTELGAERSLRSLMCSAEYRSKSSVVFYVSAKSRLIYSFHGRHEMVPSSSMWGYCLF